MCGDDAIAEENEHYFIVSNFRVTDLLTDLLTRRALTTEISPSSNELTYHCDDDNSLCLVILKLQSFLHSMHVKGDGKGFFFLPFTCLKMPSMAH